MRFSHLLILAATSAGVFGSKTAGGWEAGMYYYEYRIDREANGDNANIGKGCKGTHSRGGCNFPEFVDWYQQKSVRQVLIRVTSNGLVNPATGKREPTGKFDPAKFPSDIDKENPDIRKTAEIMDWDGPENPQYGKNPKVTERYYKYEGKYDIKKLLGDKATGIKTHGDMLNAMGDITQSNRKKLGDDKIHSLLTKATGALDNVILNREKDNAANLIRDFQIMVLDKIDKNMKSPSKKYTDPTSGETYDVWDSDKMAQDVDNNQSLDAGKKQKLRDAIIEYSTNYNTKKELSEKPNSSGATHYRDITAAQAKRSKLFGTPDACS
ncbi:hypothetical protein BDV96DRAFT_652655 [Lophiotrema nucula]|uniref:Uncharacterized protein n=1 Tax=Lophiotrema nucula TaxID=690887 RepID=A0A6A5YRL7_9PLEO|nr:hypothetical protein BDV96DRAFT_652655 [Lophiotrema nucula]